MYMVDVDTGGTMTDALVTGGGAVVPVKVDTTPHDFTVSFLECLAEAGKRLGFAELDAFLENVQLVRWSSTITSNVLAQRRGPKLGLLVSPGHEENLYGNGRSAALGWLVAPQNVIALEEHLEPGVVLAAVKRLLEEGVRRICVSFRGAFPDAALEHRAKRVVEEQYPDHYLGSVPVLLGSDMAETPDDLTRTHYSLINAYTHSALASSLFKAEDLLKLGRRWNGTLLVGHTSGGVARIGKTKAVDTIESGPVFGTFAAADFARRYRLGAVACLDVGGTTAKASIVRGGEPVFQRGGELVGIPARTSFALLRSGALGGGSVARVTDGALRLGPDSMGASPGPACYGLGGGEATLTDAFLALGTLDPERFLGGRRKLDLDKALRALDSGVAKPLGISLETAAHRVTEKAVEIVAALVRGVLDEAGVAARDAALFAYGGNGPLFAAAVAERLGTRRAFVFALGSVFGCYGSAISDILHVYERHVGGAAAPALAAAQSLRAQAERDLEGEGLDPARAEITLEVDAGEGPPVRSPFAEAERALGGGKPSVLRLRARFLLGSVEPLRRSGGAGADAARLGERPVVFRDRTARAPVLDWDALAPGASVGGPAVLVAGTTTCLVPPGWSIVIDELGNGVLESSG